MEIAEKIREDDWRVHEIETQSAAESALCPPSPTNHNHVIPSEAESLP
jgi:hypothetical protein